MRDIKILITEYENATAYLEGMAEDENFDELDDDNGIDADEFYRDNVTEIETADDLEEYWRDNGWTLDRGYGGEGYKERVADSTNWNALFEIIRELYSVDEEFGGITITPTQLNDLVIFSEEWDPDQQEDDDDSGEPEDDEDYDDGAEYA